VIDGYLSSRGEATLAEIEEESNPFINNGLPLIKTFADVTRSSSECDQLLLLLQIATQKVDDK
jgi:hypothetical protein